MRKHRGIILPNCTPHKFNKKDVRANTSNNLEESKIWNTINGPINGPINNPKNIAKRKEARRKYALEWHNTHNPNSLALTDEEVSAVANKIIESWNIGGKGTLCELSTNPNFTFYFGETMQELTREDLRFLTARGANIPDNQAYKGKRNRPVIVKEGGRTIKMKEAREEYGFRSQVVFESAILLDASRVEDALQTKFHNLPLGYRRLWRRIAKGKNWSKDDVEEKEVYKVFVTFSMKVRGMIDAGKLIIQEGAPPKADAGGKGEDEDEEVWYEGDVDEEDEEDDDVWM